MRIPKGFGDRTRFLRAFAASLLLAHASPVSRAADPAPAPLGKTFFQTNVHFDPGIALPSDFVVVHRHGDPKVGEAFNTWEAEGYSAARMFFIGSDAERRYTGGAYDGVPHLDEAETRRDGSIIECAGVRPYMVPTEGWTRYIREMTADSIQQGARAILPEEPLAHTHAGYSEAFKQIYEERYGEPWAPPHSSPEAFWKSSKLKSDLYYELVEATLEETTKAEKETGREIPFVLPIHSLLSHAAGNMVYPSGRSLDLIEKGLDGFVGQVWTGPIAWSMSASEGRRMTREEDFFESAYLLYSYFANLAYGTDAPCFMLADPVEDDPQYTWENYRIWYRQSLVTLLSFPWVDRFEVMPWPDRVFLPGYSMGGETPGPEDYRRSLVSIFQSLRDIAETPVSDFDRESGPVLGYLVNDALGWRRGGPSPSRMESLHGLTVPLLKRGIPIQIVPLERSGEPEYLDRFDLLVLSYDMMKPLSASHHEDLVGWVQRGGVLAFVGAADEYDALPEWWTKAGFEKPSDHLRAEIDRAGAVWEVTEGLPFPLSQTDLGKGRVLWIEAPSAEFAESSEWAGAYLDLLEETARARDWKVEEGGAFLTERGDYTVVRTTEKPLRLEGRHVDLFDPDLSIQMGPTIPPHSTGFYRRIEKNSEVPGVLHSGPAPTAAAWEGDVLSISLRAPETTPVTIRLALAGKEIAQAVLIRGEERIELAPTVDLPTDSALIVAPVGWTGGEIRIDFR